MIQLAALEILFLSFSLLLLLLLLLLSLSLSSLAPLFTFFFSFSPHFHPHASLLFSLSALFSALCSLLSLSPFLFCLTHCCSFHLHCTWDHYRQAPNGHLSFFGPVACCHRDFGDEGNQTLNPRGNRCATFCLE